MNERFEDNSKDSKWKRIMNQLNEIRDIDDNPIEENIIETVAALILNDFVTTDSCEGHLDRVYPWPWVNIASRLAADTRYIELDEKNDKHNFLDHEKEEYEQLKEILIQENLEEYSRLKDIVDEFYQLPRSDGSSMKLRVVKQGHNRGRLEPEGIPDGSPPEIRGSMTEEKIEEILHASRAEMKRFSQFLLTRPHTDKNKK